MGTLQKIELIMGTKIVQLHMLFGVFSLLAMNAIALEWHRGILQIDLMDPGVQMQNYGETNRMFHEFNQALQIVDLVQFSAESEAAMYFRLSTGMSAEWKGPGEFSIDRFEHSWPPISMEASEREYTRTLFYLNQGYLFIDMGLASDTDTSVIKTPLGTLLCQNAIFAIDLEDFKGSDKKACMVYCYSGSLTFEGLDGSVLKLTQGNKLALLLKKGLLKVTTIILDGSDRTLWDQFKRQWKQFTDPDQYPKVSIPVVREGPEPALKESAARTRDYFYMPVLPPVQSFDLN